MKAIRLILLAIWMYLPTYLANNYIITDPNNQVGFVGNIVRARQAKKDKKRLKRRRRRAGSIADRIEDIREDKPELDIDRSGFDDYTQALDEQAARAQSEVARASYDVATAGGAPAGDELQRDQNRQATANTVSRALNTMGGGSSALAALAIADGQERAVNRSIDQGSLARIEANQQQAEGRRQQSLAREQQAAARQASGIMQVTQANQDLDILEYQENDLNPYLQASSDARQLDSAIDAARAQRWEAMATVADDYIAERRRKKDQALKIATLGLGSGNA